MNNSKKINTNYSSLVGLKAEVLRKHAEVQDAKSKIDPTTTLSPKPKVKTKKNKKKIKEEKYEKPKVIEIEDVDTLNKSKYMLEAKSRLYEKLKKGGDKDHHFLVDFSRKPESESEDEIYREEDYDDDPNSDPEEDWVDYQDCFGRTRKCLRRDLPKMREKDNLVKREIVEEPEDKKSREEEEQEISSIPQPPVFIPPEVEPEIELLRKKWEEQTEKLAHKPDIHYQDILFDEARSHGVGYYAFSQDEEERARQQTNLTKLRKETEQRQKEMAEIRDLKDKMEQNRLKAARIRRRIRAGLPAEPEEEEEIPKPLEIKIEDETQKSNSDNVELNSTNQEGNSLAVIEDKIRAFGELLGKRPKFRELSQEEWIHKRRKDRQGEFAPVYDNFIPGGHLNATKDNKILEREDNSDDPVRINTAGPEPTDFWESTGPIETDGNSEAEKSGVNDNCFVPDESSVHDESEIIGPVPPPSITTNIPTNSMMNPVSYGIIPPIEILRSIPPPMFHPVPSVLNENPEIPFPIPEAESDTDSDDSEIIGPMPPPTIKVDNDLISDIPLPVAPPSNIDNQNLNSDKISAGLKFLRQKFDKNSSS